MPVDPCARRAVKLQEEGDFYEGVAQPRRTSMLYDQFDALGRAQREMHLGLLDVNGDEKVIVRTYADDDTTWVREHVTFEQISDLAGNVAAATRTYYGPLSGAVLPLGQVGPGFVREVHGMLDAATWPLQSSQSYDSCGNVTSLYEQGVTRTIGYEACLFPTSETVSPGAGLPPLVWTETWDHGLGVPVSMVDPNQDATAVGYDTLARPTTLTTDVRATIGLAPPHTHFAYAWSAPHPTTTTWVFDGHASALSEPWPGGPHWRQTVTVFNGASEELFSSTPTGDGRFIVNGWRERDDRGHVVLMAEPFYATAASPAARAPDARVQTVSYDALSRVVDHTLPNGAITHNAYAAFQQTVSVSSRELADVISFSDGLSRIVRTERTVNGILESADATYDAADRITALALPGGVTHTFVHDRLGRLASAFDPDTGERELTYDDRNFLIDHLNGTGQHVFF
jgi:YD repeat-containing protein